MSESIWVKTSYDNYEIIVVENNSEEKDTFAYYESDTAPEGKISGSLPGKESLIMRRLIILPVSYAQGEYLLFLIMT